MLTGYVEICVTDQHVRESCAACSGGVSSENAGERTRLEAAANRARRLIIGKPSFEQHLPHRVAGFLRRNHGAANAMKKPRLDTPSIFLYVVARRHNQPVSQAGSFPP